MPALAGAATTVVFGNPESVMAFGKVLKAVAGPIEVNFGYTFKEPPLVFLTPEWPAGGVGYVETVMSVDTDKFRLSSNNAAGNYHVNWLAIGKKP